MISQARERARETGFRAILLYGGPDYYSRCGFVPAETPGIRTAGNMYAPANCRKMPCGMRGRYVEAAALPLSGSKK